MRELRSIIALAGSVLIVCLVVLTFAAGCTGRGEPAGAPEDTETSSLQEIITQARLKVAGARAKLASYQAQAADTPPPPAPEAPVDPGAGRGPAGGQQASSVSIPSVSGMSYESAVATLSGLGFRVSAAEDYSRTVAAGLVCSQSPGPGDSAARGSVISVVISLGPALAVCPSCGGAGSAAQEYTCPDCGGTGWCYT